MRRRRLALTGHAAKNVVSQNGVKYRTLCKDCNEYIGAEYDETLNQFVRSIGRILQVSQPCEVIRVKRSLHPGLQQSTAGEASSLRAPGTRFPLTCGLRD